MTKIAGFMCFRKLSLLFFLVLGFGTSQAEFGEYSSHSIEGQALIVETEVGSLRITVIDDAGFEVHYQETGVKQLPSFALAGPPPQIRAAVTETDDRLEFGTSSLTAVVYKWPLRVEYHQNGQPLVAEESGLLQERLGNRLSFRAG